MNVSGAVSNQIDHPARSLVVPLLIFLIPVAFFRKNIRIYFYLLLPLVFIIPVLIFLIHFFSLVPGFGMIAFIMQTNLREAREAASPFLPYFIPFEIVFVGLYFFAVNRIPRPALSLRSSAIISGLSLMLLAMITANVNGLFAKRLEQISKYDLLLKYDFPVALVSGVNEARIFLKKNTLDKAENFAFGAVKMDSIHQRQVYVLIIGESSRYDRWQINGWKRDTSPRLAARKDLITCSDVIAGAHYTWVSVPQIITRADPDNYDLQYREKSILAAFHEAGFKTVWLSNQSDQDIFWSGTITLHAKTADVSFFSPTYSPNLEFEDVYDGRLLPKLDSILRADDRNLFIVLHTLGNHWEYSRRYPVEFDLFKPSGYTQVISPPDASNREAILNSYDNSILYADFIIDQVIISVSKAAAVSTVVFVSDHGEDLYDADPYQLDFHFRPSVATLKVPLFIWTSQGFNNVYPGKRRALEANKGKKIGSGDMFYTVLDMANIRMGKFDSTRSFAGPWFEPRQQKYYNEDKRAISFPGMP